MKRFRLGILGTADIAFRRFLPALMKSEQFEYIGIASRNIANTYKFIDEFGGKGFSSYDELIESSEVEALYIPLPPALHYYWAKKALEHNKHVLLEKPFTMDLDETKHLVEIAEKSGLGVHENYMFKYHQQLKKIIEMLEQKVVGDVREYRIAFGFPMREKNDFRYNRELGGGALLDCGGYTLSLASILLGENIKIVSSVLNNNQYEVDLFGSAMLVNDKNIVAQLAFGMDNDYKCELEIWGSKGSIVASRIFTAPADYEPQIFCKTQDYERNITVSSDDQFLKSILRFGESIKDKQKRKESYNDIVKQAVLVDCIKKQNNN